MRQSGLWALAGAIEQNGVVVGNRAVQAVAASKRSGPRAGLRAALVACTIAGAGALGGCSSETHLTLPPLQAEATAKVPSALTTLSVLTPLDLDSLTNVLTRVTARRGTTITGTVPAAACIDVRKRRVCEPARVAGTLVNDPGVTVAAVSGGKVGSDGVLLEVRVPIVYALNASGRRRASLVSETISGRVEAVFAAVLVIEPGYQVGVLTVRPPRLPEAHIDVLAAKLDLTPWLLRHLNGASVAIRDALNTELARLPLAAAAEAAWGALHEPLNISRDDEPALYLTAVPRRLGTAVVASVSGRLGVGLTIEADVAFERARPTVMPYKRPLPTLTWPRQPGNLRPHERSTRREADTPGEADPAIEPADPLVARDEWLLPVSMPRSLLGRRIMDALGTGDLFRPDASRDRETIVEVLGAEARGALRYIGIAVRARVIAPDRFSGLVGTIHLVARPELDGATGTLRLAGVSVPTIVAPDTRVAHADLVVDMHPLKQRLDGLAFDLAALQARGDVAPHSGSSVGARPQITVALDGNLRLEATPGAVSVDEVRAVANDIILYVRMRGRLNLIYDPGRTLSAGRMPADTQIRTGDRRGPATQIR